MYKVFYDSEKVNEKYLTFLLSRIMFPFVYKKKNSKYILKAKAYEVKYILKAFSFYLRRGFFCIVGKVYKICIVKNKGERNILRVS